MSLPKLKHIKVDSEQQLDVWLAKNSSQQESVMLVAHANRTHIKFVSREQIRQTLNKHSWEAGPCHTIGSDLLGHVITTSRS